LREALVIVLGDGRFYSRFGFKPSIYFGIESTFNVPLDAFMVKFLKNYHPNYKGQVIYPATFRNVSSIDKIITVYVGFFMGK
jgi:putative acetyltransferase